MRYFDLDGNEIPEEQFVALYANTQLKQIRRTKTEGGYVSTVWLGIDHNWLPTGPPLIFETMVFGGPMDTYQRRYSTYWEAVAGHDEIVTLEAMEREFV